MSEQSKTGELIALRDQIDALDLQILALINCRAELAGQIGALKSGPLYRPEREAQVLERIRQHNGGPLPDANIMFLFREIMSACLAFERPVSVAFLGPSGTYSETAAIRHFGHAAETRNYPSLEDVFHAAESGATQYAVVPVENSTEGAIARTLDLMVDSPLQICGEILLRIRHQLLVPAGVTDLKSISRVYAHAQSLGQCRHWLNANLPQAERIPVSSNAEAAKMARQEPGCAAIAGTLAAERYELTVLAPNIEDEANNTTRFLVLGMHPAGPSGQDKTSLVLSTPNRPGAIHDLLAPLATHGVSMTRLESRPARTALWEYVFFVDIEGHQSLPAVQEALATMKENARFFKCLGSYPRAIL
jgi:chorismate mutase/prephenate dehydratase